MELQRYESLAQAAERTGISRKTLRRRIAAGQLPVFSADGASSASGPRTSTPCCVRSGSGERSVQATDEASASRSARIRAMTACGLSLGEASSRSSRSRASVEAGTPSRSAAAVSVANSSSLSRT